MSYKIKEIFYSLQGEGVRAGCPSVFVRFAGCNLRCKKDVQGFNCDTSYSWEGGEDYELLNLVNKISAVAGKCLWIVFTGGEPSLQVDRQLVDSLRSRGFKLAIETNGTNPLPANLDWITCAPKLKSRIKIHAATEVKFVVCNGGEVPETDIRADHYLISPACEDANLPLVNLQYCIKLCHDNPKFRLSVQQHKQWDVR